MDRYHRLARSDPSIILWKKASHGLSEMTVHMPCKLYLDISNLGLVKLLKIYTSKKKRSVIETKIFGKLTLYGNVQNCHLRGWAVWNISKLIIRCAFNAPVHWSTTWNRWHCVARHLENPANCAILPLTDTPTFISIVLPCLNLTSSEAMVGLYCRYWMLMLSHYHVQF